MAEEERTLSLLRQDNGNVLVRTRPQGLEDKARDLTPSEMRKFSPLFNIFTSVVVVEALFNGLCDFTEACQTLETLNETKL